MTAGLEKVKMKETRIFFIYKIGFYCWPDPVREAQPRLASPACFFLCFYCRNSIQTNTMAKTIQINVGARLVVEST